MRRSPRVSRRRLRHVVPQACVGLIISLGTFVALECAANVYLKRFAGEKRFLHYASVRQLKHHPTYAAWYRQIYARHNYLRYYPTPNYQIGKNRHNSLGYRGEDLPQPKPAGEFWIACLGESTTYTSAVDDYRLSYPAQLERSLIEQGYRVRVINAGVGGWSTWESLINLEFRVLDLEPDLIIVYHGMNDVYTRLVWPPAAYRGDNTGAEGPTQEGIVMPNILEYSTLARAILLKLRLIQPHYSLRRIMFLEPETSYGRAFIEQKLNGTYPSGKFTQVSAQQMLATNRPVYFQRNMEHLVAIARQHRMRPVLATFGYCPTCSDQPTVSSPEFISALEEFNGVVRAVGKTMHAPVFDYARVASQEPRDYIDGYHTTEEGSRRMGELFARYLIQQRLLSLRSHTP